MTFQTEFELQQEGPFAAHPCLSLPMILESWKSRRVSVKRDSALACFKLPVRVSDVSLPARVMVLVEQPRGNIGPELVER